MSAPYSSEFKPEQSLVLIVDDHPKNLQLLGNVLGEEGYRVAAALNGDQALIVARKNVPDLILLDVMMPKMDGYEVCRTLHESASMKHVPVIFLTARASPEDVMRGFQEGGMDYITKPFQVEEVLARVRVHLQLRWARDRLKEYNTNLEQLLETRTQSLIKAEREAVFALMVQGIVHNIKTPLAAIHGSAEFIRVHIQKMKALGIPGHGENAGATLKHLEAAEESIGVITHASTMLNDMVRSLLAKSRSDKASEVETADLNQIVESELEFLEADLSFKHNVTKTVHLTPSHLMVQVVPSEIAQVIHNLIRNALDAMLDTSAPTLEVTTSSNGNWLQMTVQDNGSGIPQDILPRIFDPFFTTKSTDGRGGGPQGTGLGLHTCRQIVESYNGDILVDSKPGVGTAVTIKIPLALTAVAV